VPFLIDEKNFRGIMNCDSKDSLTYEIISTAGIKRAKENNQGISNLEIKIHTLANGGSRQKKASFVQGIDIRRSHVY